MDLISKLFLFGDIGSYFKYLKEKPLYIVIAVVVLMIITVVIVVVTSPKKKKGDNGYNNTYYNQNNEFMNYNQNVNNNDNINNMANVYNNMEQVDDKEVLNNVTDSVVVNDSFNTSNSEVLNNEVNTPNNDVLNNNFNNEVLNNEVNTNVNNSEVSNVTLDNKTVNDNSNDGVTKIRPLITDETNQTPKIDIDNIIDSIPDKDSISAQESSSINNVSNISGSNMENPKIDIDDIIGSIPNKEEIVNDEEIEKILPAESVVEKVLNENTDIFPNEVSVEEFVGPSVDINLVDNSTEGATATGTESVSDVNNEVSIEDADMPSMGSNPVEDTVEEVPSLEIESLPNVNEIEAPSNINNEFLSNEVSVENVSAFPPSLPAKENTVEDEPNMEVESLPDISEVEVPMDVRNNISSNEIKVEQIMPTEEVSSLVEENIPLSGDVLGVPEISEEEQSKDEELSESDKKIEENLGINDENRETVSFNNMFEATQKLDLSSLKEE